MADSTIKFTIAGDADSLKQAVKEAGAALKQAESEAKTAAQKLDIVGERFDTVDTRAMGAKDAVTGVGDSMAGVAAIAHGDLNNGLQLTLAGLSDLGSAGYNTVAPMLKTLVTRFGAMKVAAFGALGAVGLVAGALWLMSSNGDKAGKATRDLTKDVDVFVKSGGKLTGQLKDLFVTLDAGISGGSMDAMLQSTQDFQQAAEDLGGALVQAADDGASYEQIVTALTNATGASRAEAEAYVASNRDLQVALSGASERQTALNANLMTTAEQFKVAAQNLTTFTDLLRAQTDPIFAHAKAIRDAKAARQEYDKAVQEHGKDSDEAKLAQEKLAEAELGVWDASQKLATVNKEQLTPELQALMESGYLSADSMAYLAGQLSLVEFEAQRAQAALAKVQGKVGTPTPPPASTSGPYVFKKKMHSGGIVPGAPGEEVPILAQAGERIIPLSGGTSSNTTVVVDLRLVGDGVLEVVRQQVAAGGGNVQTVVGR